MTASAAIERLLAIMTALRDPRDGCPWDQVQTYATIAPHTIEEAYEVADAIDRGALDELKGELGDLLLQVVYHAQMAREDGAFDFAAVAEAISDKLVARHPHVFGDASIADSDAQTLAWEARKAQERRRRAEAEGRVASVLDGVPVAMPALTRAVKLQSRAARVGFDWSEAAQVLDKIEEEIGEVREEMTASNRDHGRIEDEMGDLLFACVNLARKLKVDPETALRRTNLKFERRFGRIEGWLAEDGRTPDQSSLDEMEALWQRAKAAERDAVDG